MCVYLNVWAPCVCRHSRGKNWAEEVRRNLQEQELEVAVCHRVGVGNQT